MNICRVAIGFDFALLVKQFGFVYSYAAAVCNWTDPCMQSFSLLFLLKQTMITKWGGVTICQKHVNLFLVFL